MADDVVIGSASVQIVGDYSGLEKSFTESQNLAQAAGQKISAAFDSTASGASALTTAVAMVATTVEDLAAKSGLAGGELNLFRAALQGSLEAGVPVDAALKDMAASSATLGTAVAGASQSLMKEAEAADASATALNHEAVAAGTATSANQTAATSFTNLGASVTQTNADFAKFADGVQAFISHPLQTAGASAKEFLLAIGPMGAVALAGAAALFEVGQALFHLVDQFGQAAEATGNMADRLNLTWRETRNLEEMAQIAGVSITGLQQASFRLAESLDETSTQGKKVREALQSIGVQGETSGQLLTGFLQKLAQIPDDTQRIALAHEVLGRASQQILPLIKNYGELQHAIQELGPAIGDELAGNLQKSDDALDKLNISWNRFKESVAAQVAPAVGALVDQLRGLIVETSKLAQETIGSAKALAGLIPDGLLQSIGEYAKTIIYINSLANPFIVGIRGMIAALQEFNVLVGAISGKAASDMATGIQKMDTLLKTNLTTSLHAATTGSKEFLDIWKNAGGGVASVIDSILASQAKLSGNVRDAKAAYDQLNEAFKNGTTVANGHKVTVDDVARALANLKAAEAAAATTKVDHTEKIKAMSAALREQSPLITAFISGYKEVTKGVADWEKATGQLITRTDYLKMKVDEATRSMAEFYGGARDIFGVFTGLVDGPIPNFLAAAEKISPLMDEITASIDETAQAALDTSPYAALEEALQTLGIKGSQYFKDLADAADEAYQTVKDSGVATYEELSQAALVAAAAEIRAALEVGEITRSEADKTLAQIQSDLDTLDASHAASTQSRGRRERTLGEDIQNINRKTFDSIERGLADTIVNLKGFDDLWKTLWQGLAKDLLNIMFKVLLDPLEKAIGKVLGGVFGGAGSAAGTAAGGAASAGGTAASGASSAGGAAASGLTGILGTVFGGLTAASSIFGNFQAAQSETTLNAIEESTRYLKIGLVTQGDSLLNDSHTIRNTLTDMMSFNWNVQATYFQGISEKLDKLISFGGIHSSTTQAQVSTFSTNKAVVADQSTNVNVTIDTVASDITDTKVRDVFNRGIRMSKLAGAFPAGRFPQ